MALVAEGTSKKGTPYIIRYPGPGDAQSAWEYINRLSKERTFVRLQGEEVTLEEETRWLQKFLKKIEEGTAVLLVLECGGTYAGVCSVELSDRTESHAALLALSVDASVRGEGLGEILLRTTIGEAEKRLKGLRTITLSVKAPNDAARALYEKAGFKEYGVLPGGTRHRGEFVDQVYMYRPVGI